MRLRYVFGLGILGFVIAALIAGKGSQSAPASNTGAGVDWYQVDVGRGSACLPVAATPAALAKGLMGVRDPLEPLVFKIATARPVAFWMHDTPTPLVGVWVGINGRVFGYWHGKADSDSLDRSRRAVTLVLEYKPGVRVPKLGARVSITSETCAMGPGL
jgi:uncharacterized membrane protein (UPF0127 family)